MKAITPHILPNMIHSSLEVLITIIRANVAQASVVGTSAE